MVQIGIQLIWLALYQYYIEQVCELEKGYIKRIVVWSLSITALLVMWTAAFLGRLKLVSEGAVKGVSVGCWFGIALILLLYALFYDGKPFGMQWRKVLTPGIMLSLCAVAGTPWISLVLNGAVMTAFLLLLTRERGYLRLWNGLLNAGIYGFLGCYIWNVRNEAGEGVLLGIAALEFLFFLALEGALFSYHQGFEVQTEMFQRDILGNLSEYEGLAA